MSNKYNTKKKTLLGEYLKTSLEGTKKGKLRYANVDSNWKELEETKSVQEP